MKTKAIIQAVLLIFALTPAISWARPDVKLSIKSEKEVVQIKNGKKIIKRVPAKTVSSGKTLIFVLRYVNQGKDPAVNVKFNNPISEEGEYLVGSAKGKGSTITFSIDGGKNFKKPGLLTYEVVQPNGKKKKKVASPEQYTHVRWLIPRIAPGGKGQLEFKVRIK